MGFVIDSPSCSATTSLQFPTSYYGIPTSYDWALTLSYSGGSQSGYSGGSQPGPFTILTDQIAPSNPLQPAQDLPDSWQAPFFFFDSQYAFYVEQAYVTTTTIKTDYYGVPFSVAASATLPPIVLRDRIPPSPIIPDPIGPGPYETNPGVIATNPAEQLVARSDNFSTVIATTGAFTYDNETIGALGNVAALGSPPERAKSRSATCYIRCRQATHQEQDDYDTWGIIGTYSSQTSFTYTFENFFHPYVGALISKLNTAGQVADLFDPVWLESLRTDFFASTSSPLTTNDQVVLSYFPASIDTSIGGPYSNYNWELFFHIPLMVAVNLSKNQRFAEAQRWFHLIFDPTVNSTAIPPWNRYWKFIGFWTTREGSVAGGATFAGGTASVAASQTATISSISGPTVGDVLNTTINGVLVTYSVVASDTLSLV